MTSCCRWRHNGHFFCWSWPMHWIQKWWLHASFVGWTMKQRHIGHSDSFLFCCFYSRCYFYLFLKSSIFYILDIYICDLCSSCFCISFSKTIIYSFLLLNSLCRNSAFVLFVYVLNSSTWITSSSLAIYSVLSFLC